MQKGAAARVMGFLALSWLLAGLAAPCQLLFALGSDAADAGAKDTDVSLLEIKAIPASPELYSTPTIVLVVANVGKHEIPKDWITLRWKLFRLADNTLLEMQSRSGCNPRLAPGETSEWQEKYIQFRMNEIGLHRLEIELFVGSEFDALDQNPGNNVRQVDLTVLPGEKPDWMASGITFVPGNPAPGTPFQINAEFKNLGPGVAVKLPYAIRVRRSGALVKEHASTLSFSGIVEAGRAATVSLALRLKAGNYTVEAVADEAGLLAESDETNNRLTRDFSLGNVLPRLYPPANPKLVLPQRSPFPSERVPPDTEIGFRCNGQPPASLTLDLAELSGLLGSPAAAFQATIEFNGLSLLDLGKFGNDQALPPLLTATVVPQLAQLDEGAHLACRLKILDNQGATAYEQEVRLLRRR